MGDGTLGYRGVSWRHDRRAVRQEHEWPGRHESIVRSHSQRLCPEMLSLQREEAHPPRDPVDRVERVCHEADEPEIRELARPVTLPPDRPEETAGFVVDPDLSVDGLSDVDVALGSDGEAVHRRDSD